jgi:hypothetical protein
VCALPWRGLSLPKQIAQRVGSPAHRDYAARRDRPPCLPFLEAATGAIRMGRHRGLPLHRNAAAWGLPRYILISATAWGLSVESGTQPQGLGPKFVQQRRTSLPISPGITFPIRVQSIQNPPSRHRLAFQVPARSQMIGRYHPRYDRRGRDSEDLHINTFLIGLRAYKDLDTRGTAFIQVSNGCCPGE